MVGHNEYSPALVLLQGLVNRANDVFVDLLDSFFLELGVSVVACFVRCLYMDEDKVIFFECVYCCAGFAFVICVNVAGCSRYVYYIKADEF